MSIMLTFLKNNKVFWLLVSILQVAVIGAIDYVTGYDLAFSPIYLFPIVTTTWFVSKNLGIVFALLSSIAWLAADYLTQHPYSNPSFFLWNTLIRLANYLVVVYLVARVKRELVLQNQLARTDSLTGLANNRSFFEFLQQEIARFSRFERAFSVMYIDLDDFKQINDSYGHKEGDRVLSCIAQVFLSRLRKTDLAARIGGDEFAVVLPETGEEEAFKLSKELIARMAAEMEQQKWCITFSLGVVTIEKGAVIVSAESILQQADQLMYQVKNNGKNNIRHASYQSDSAAS